MEKKKNKNVYVVVEIMLCEDSDYFIVDPLTYDNYKAAKEFFEDRKEQITRQMLEYRGCKDRYEIFQEKYDEEEKYVINEYGDRFNSIGLVLRKNIPLKENAFAERTEEEKRNAH